MPPRGCWFVLALAACQMEAPPRASPAVPPTPVPRDAPLDPALGLPLDAGASVADPGCIRDERQWGTTCCRVEGAPGRRRWMSCRGPQLGKECHKKGDCDITCGCDRELVHHDGQTGVTGHCTGFMPSGEWLCTIDEAGKVSSLIID